MIGEPNDDEIQVEALDDELGGPRLRGTVIARRNAEDLYDALASDLIVHSANCVRQFGDFHLALSGGRTPFPLYERLMYDPRFRILPWRRTHLWIVDERCVPFESELSNFSRIKEVIVDHSDIPPEQVHPMLANTPESADRYERELRDTLGWRPKGHDRLDFVLLGMGLDGHTASIFPGSPALHGTDRLVMDVAAPTTSTPAVPRCTLTMQMLNASRFVAPFIMGADKAPILQRIADGASPDELPIAGLRPIAGELRWFLDAAACGRS